MRRVGTCHFLIDFLESTIKQHYDEQGAAFFFKQWGGTNKKKAGRELAGNIYNDMPDRLQVL